MSWHDKFPINSEGSKLGNASYNGKRFFVRVGEFTGGRRTVIHEYPLRDEPFAEDLGRAPRRFEVEGYVIGDDYLTARDALINEFETATTGELVHPLYGTKRVTLDGPFRVRETNQDGGMAIFSLTFIETPLKPVQPTAAPDATGLLAASTSNAQSVVSSEFSALYKPGLLMTSISLSLQSAMGKVNAVLAVSTMDSQALARLQSQVTNLASNAAAIASEPAALLNGLIGVFDAVTDVLGLRSVYAYDPGDVPPATTPDRIVEQQNFLALHQFIQRLALIQAATLLPSQTFTSYEDAVTQRDALTALIDDQAENAADDTYPSLVQLRADLVKAVPGANSDLAHLVDYKPQTTVPSLVLAHRLYGNLDLEQDIIDRNDIQNPGFILGGVPLEVLSNE